MTSMFASVEDEWRERLRMLPNTVRQELVTRQLNAHLPAPPARILDVGCGQGTQALRLARLGYDMTGLDHSPAMLADFDRTLAEQPSDVRSRVRLVQGEGDCLVEYFPSERFDAVICHGVLMYLADPVPMLQEMARMLAPGGTLSLLVRNGDALALYPGLRGDWTAARAAFGTTSYRNRLGVEARADRLSELTAQLADVGLEVHRWYGVLTFCEFAAMESTVPAARELAEIVACEEQAGSTDPYRGIAALLHVAARLQSVPPS
ncbi:class I SAM-dependent methyltransferase [Streptosporangium roseum]|uniref:class I SAM-dependent methyltransferase n=1 Tax=Streptosporangium roseum TaxID=2001 RepID=UPI0004CD148C|nr:class I SAM-dependent methyltransferase [Streptosporangium roseum]